MTVCLYISIAGVFDNYNICLLCMWGYTSLGTELLLYEYLCYTDVRVSVSSFLACWSLVFLFLLLLLRHLLLYCCCCCWSSCVVHCCQFLKMVVVFRLKMCCVLHETAGNKCETKITGCILKQDPNTQRVMMKWCLMSSDVGWHIRDKLRPMPKHGSINLYVHGSQKAR